MKRLDRKLDKRQEIKKQFNEWKEEKFNYSLHYLSNITKLALGYKPSYVSPKNLLPRFANSMYSE